jgi:lysophospholipase
MEQAASFDRRAIPPAAREWRWRAPDGHEIRVIDWPNPAQAKHCGSILFMAGRGDAYEKYLETFEDWRLRGWRVSAADWRGQAGSGRLGFDEVTGHVDDFTLWIEDLASFWAGWAQGRDRALVLAGHSMGGHLVLRAQADRLLAPEPAAMILSAPMLDVGPERAPLTLRRGLARIMCTVGDARRPAWKWNEKPGVLPAARKALLTHDDARYADELWWREKRPELVMGPGSWGWVAGALRSIRKLSHPGVIERVRVPVFMFATRADGLVSFRAVERAAERLPNVETLYFGTEARHEILRETDEVRNRALNAIDAFLDRVCAS